MGWDGERMLGGEDISFGGRDEGRMGKLGSGVLCCVVEKGLGGFGFGFCFWWVVGMKWDNQ